MRFSIHLYILIFLVFLSCETKVNPELDNSLNVLVIDAWLTNHIPTQHIKLTRSQPYFEESLPAGVSGASVKVVDLEDGTEYLFEEDSNRYTWRSPDGNNFGTIGHNYELQVAFEGNTYTSTTTLNDVPPIDSIQFVSDDVYDEIYAEFYARDLEGLDDTYWIKTWVNDEFLGSSGDIKIAYDASFSSSSESDGKVFIEPIRYLTDISPPRFLDVEDNIVYYEDGNFFGRIEDDSLFFDEGGDDFISFGISISEDPNYELIDDGKTLVTEITPIYVEIHSISNEAHFFLNQVFIETNREGGFGSLFATPLVNVSTNIVRKQGDLLVAGFFNIAAVSSKENRLIEPNQIVTR